ncbi:type II toxin-antitoxin system Phd/YefM family antitoxin, partial [Staphylococcus aureus]|nr:type II toxin-antitoxin system Phd/YefM family antitoxin [Staphylococcus aureus]
MIITSPTEARKDFYQLLKNVNNNYEPIYISGNNAENNAVIIGLEDCTSRYKRQC